MNYDEFYELSRPKSSREKMSASDRAAQFSPFAALNGHDDALSEAARRVDKKIELSSSQTELLDQKMRIILSCPDCEVCVTYYVPDEKKQGGMYKTVRGTVVKTDEILRGLVMDSGEFIPFEDVFDIEGDIFDKNFFE